MPHHRFYSISPSGTRSVPHDLECQSDFAALMHAGSLYEQHGSVEVWQGNRFVGEIGVTSGRWASKTSPDRPVGGEDQS